MECVKCGGSMKGPVYCDGRVFHCHHEWYIGNGNPMDHLAFSCTTCGFVTCTVTKQAAESRKAADAVDLQNGDIHV